MHINQETVFLTLAELINFVYHVEILPAKENPPRNVQASFPGPDLLPAFAFGNVGRCGHVSDESAFWFCLGCG